VAFLSVEAREMEDISRGPTFGDFVTIRTEASMQDVTFERLQSTRVQTPSLPPLLNVMYCVRVSLRTVKIFPYATLKRRWSWVISLYLWLKLTGVGDILVPPPTLDLRSAR
jgi:hypothetical protein